MRRGHFVVGGGTDKSGLKRTAIAKIAWFHRPSPFLGYLRRQAMNSTLQSLYCQERQLPGTKWSIFHSPSTKEKGYPNKLREGKFMDKSTGNEMNYGWMSWEIKGMSNRRRGEIFVAVLLRFVSCIWWKKGKKHSTTCFFLFVYLSCACYIKHMAARKVQNSELQIKRQEDKWKI